MELREIDDRYPEYARPYEPTGQGRHHGALPWGLVAGLAIILLSALISFAPVPAPAPAPPNVVPVPEPTPTPPEPPIIIPDDPPGPPFIPDNPPDEPPEPPFIPDDPPTPPPNPPETVRYTVTFVNWDGSVLSRRTYDEGTAASAVMRPATPTRPSDGSFTYTFSGWSPDIRAVTGNITYTALYSSTPVAPRYTVTFVNWDGSQISSRQYDEGTAVSGIVVPADPTRPSDGSFRYIFYGWTPDLAPVTADATYMAVYLTEELPSYNVTFVDWDGTVLLAAAPYTEGTPASDIVTPADPTRADTAEYTYTFAGWSPDLSEVTADATYTATYTQTPRTYTAPTIDLVHELDYYDGWDDYFVDFTATVALNDVAGASGQLKLRHYNAQTGAWEWTPLSGDASEMLSGETFVQLYSVKGGARTELVPSDYNALYDIPEDAESIEAVITWRFPWYMDDDGDVMMKIREVMNLSFDYTLPNGEEGTVALSDDFYLYNDWFFDRIEEPQADATEKTLTFYYTYEVEYGGPLNYDNLYWHPHLYDHATGEELDMTPTITRVVEADGTVGDKIVYSFDTLVPGQQYDFTAEVVYSDYGVDDVDHWDNWVSTHHTYTPVGFDVEDGKYTITWKGPDGLIIDTTTVDPGEMPAHEDPTLWPTEQYTYTFTGWSPDIVPATENATYTAQVTQTLRQYPVVFVDEDGSTVLKEETLYDYGTPASDIVQPATPTKPSDATNDYTFAGWSPELAEVTEDATYMATYTATPRTYTAPEIDLVHELGYWEDADEYFAGFASDITLNDVAGATGQVKLMLKNPETGAWEQVEFTDTEFEGALVELYTTQGGTSTELTPGSGPNAAYDIPEDAETLEAVIYKHFELFDDEWNYQPRIREVVKIAFDYTLPDGTTGTVETDEFYLYNDWFFGTGSNWAADTDARTLTLTFPYQVDRGGPLDYDSIYWHPHLYWQPADDYHWGAGGTELEMTPEVSYYTEADGTVVGKIVYTFDTIVSNRIYEFEADVIYSDYGVDDADHWDNWVTDIDMREMQFEIAAHEEPVIGIFSSAEYGGDSGNWHFGIGIIGCEDIPDDLKGGKARLKFMRYDEDAGAWVDIEFISAEDWEANDAKPWSDPTKVQIGDRQMFFSDTVHIGIEGGSNTPVSTLGDPTAMIELGDSDFLYASMAYHLPLNPTWEPASTLIKPVMEFEYPDGVTGSVEGNPIRVYSGSFIGENGAVADTAAKTITLDFIIDGGPYDIDPDGMNWNHSLHWQDVSDGSYSSERYKDDPDDTHGWVAAEPTVETYDGADGKTHVRITYTLDEISTDYAYDYLGTVYYFPELEGESGMWEAFPTQYGIRFP